MFATAFFTAEIEPTNVYCAWKYAEFIPKSQFDNYISHFRMYVCMYVTERNSNFGIEDCFALNRTLKFCCIPQGKRRTLRVKNCLYFDTELFFELMTKLFWRYTFNSFYFFLLSKFLKLLLLVKSGDGILSDCIFEQPSVAYGL